MSRLLLINLLISLFWPVLVGEFTLGTLFYGFGLGFIVLALLERRYGRLSLRLFSFTLYVIYAILESNVRLAVIVLHNLVSTQPTVRPGIMAVPLELKHPLDITVLASIITLTPGTLSVDLRPESDGSQTLFVHAMHIDRPDAFRDEIKTKFEARIFQMRQLLDEMSMAQRGGTL